MTDNRVRRPWLVTGLAAALLVAGVLQLLGSQQFLQQAAQAGQVLPPERALWLRPAAALYGLGGLALLAATVGLVLMQRWGWWLALVGAPLVAASEWLLRVTLERSTYSLAARPLDALLAAGGVLVVWGVLLVPPVRRRFEVRRPAS